MSSQTSEPHGPKDPNGLASYLQTKVEADKAELTRQLHDNMGGLIVAALMDTAWAEQNLTASAGQAQEKLRRVRQSLAAAIDLKRRLIEELRPTLLDNFGLFAALSWQLKQSGVGTSLRISESFPPAEPHLGSDINIGVFRAVEEAIHVVVARKRPTSIDLQVTLDGGTLDIALNQDGQPFSDDDERECAEYSSMKHRIWRLHGTVTIVQERAASMLRLIVPVGDVGTAA